MKLVAYVRVSTDRQVEEGLGLDVQRRAIRAWAKLNGHRVALWTSDEGVTGSSGMESRVGLHDALAALKDGTAVGLVVYRLDRLARKLTVQEATLAKAWDLGASVFAVDLGEIARDDPDDPMKTALRQMIGVFAQLERGMIAARLRAGRRVKAEQGGYAGYGSPAYGTRARDGELEIDAAEQTAINRIVELHHAGASLRDIASVLATEGHRPRRSITWHPETLRRIVTRATANPTERARRGHAQRA